MKKINLLTGFLFIILGFTQAQTTFKAFQDNRNQASFESTAPLEDIVGVSNSIEASAELDPADLPGAKGIVKVDLRELKTGIDLRDEHMRGSMWLNTAEYPFIEFELTGISGASKLPDGKKTEVTLHGKLTLHGVTKEIKASAELTYYKETEATKARIEGNLLKVKTEFEIKLSDFGIKIPSMASGKVEETVKASASFIASDEVK